MNASSDTAQGRVWLIGAGPGDPELLTLRAVRALGEADVLLVDDLVHEGVLRHARPGARIVRVGKRGGCRSTPQAFIEKLMLRLARRGAVVARVKGGDPFVFGRGGEEMLALRAAGIAVEIAGGITAGLGAPAALGIPVTHRGLSRGAILVTGHGEADAEPDWAALARTGLTLVIYMGARRIAGIAAQLLAAGLPANLPAAAIAEGTRESQRQAVTTLERLAADAADAGIASPAILVIGHVAKLADALRDVVPISRAA